MAHAIRSGQVCGFSSETMPRGGRNGARKPSRMGCVNFNRCGFMRQALENPSRAGNVAMVPRGRQFR